MIRRYATTLLANLSLICSSIKSFNQTEDFPNTINNET
jgi:hypothetical protein